MELLNIFVPFLLFVAAGFALVRAGVLGYGGEQALESIVYWVALPLLLFKTGLVFDFDLFVEMAFPAAVVGAQLLTFATIIIIASWLFPGQITHLTLHAGNAVTSSTLLYGVPLVYLLFGEKGLAALMIINVLMQTPMVFISTFVAEQDVKSRIWTAPFIALFQALIHPYWALFGVGLALNYFNIHIPPYVTDITQIGAGMAVGLCLLCLGSHLMVPKILSDASEVGWIVIAKLILHPLCAWVVVSYILNMDPMLSAMVVITAALPIGGSMLRLSQAYETYILRSETATWMSIALSIFTIIPIVTYYLPVL